MVLDFAHDLNCDLLVTSMNSMMTDILLRGAPTRETHTPTSIAHKTYRVFASSEFAQIVLMGMVRYILIGSYDIRLDSVCVFYAKVTLCTDGI